MYNFCVYSVVYCLISFVFVLAVRSRLRPHTTYIIFYRICQQIDYIYTLAAHSRLRSHTAYNTFANRFMHSIMNTMWLFDRTSSAARAPPAVLKPRLAALTGRCIILISHFLEIYTSKLHKNRRLSTLNFLDDEIPNIEI